MCRTRRKRLPKNFALVKTYFQSTRFASVESYARGRWKSEFVSRVLAKSVWRRGPLEAGWDFTSTRCTFLRGVCTCYRYCNYYRYRYTVNVLTTNRLMISSILSCATATCERELYCSESADGVFIKHRRPCPDYLATRARLTDTP